jgi:DNA repair exonuclease SbcCD ATPase subunit
LQSQITEVINLQNQYLALENELGQLEKIYEQQLKERKEDLVANLNSQIKKKKTEITNILHSGKGSSAQIRKEIKELESQPSLYEKLVQNLQKARNILGTNNSLKDLTEAPNHLNSFLQELQKEDKNEVYERAYQFIKEIKEKQKKIQVTCESVEKIAKEKNTQREKIISLSKKITQKLLGKQQLETQIQIPPE